MCKSWAVQQVHMCFSSIAVMFRICNHSDAHHAVQVQGQSTKAQDPGAWATGIVEVALPVEYKMRNIEETEAAKRRLLHASRSAFSLMACFGQLTRRCTLCWFSLCVLGFISTFESHHVQLMCHL